MIKKALIFGLSGMDGSHLADFLLKNDYEVHGFVRRSSRGYGAVENIHHLFYDEKIYRQKLFLHSGDLDDVPSIDRVIKDVQPDEVYVYAAQADVQESFYMPEYSIILNSCGPLRILESLRRFCPRTKFFFASTSEMFGDEKGKIPQNEETSFNPQSPYAIGKLAGFHITKKYREMYGMFAISAISFNHCSERRTDDYLDRKVTHAIGRIKAGLQKELRLGNLDAWRDWSYAPEVVEAHWRMMQMDNPNDLVLGSGITHQVREWVETAFVIAGLDSKNHVIFDPSLIRPAEVNILQADATLAKQLIGWNPQVGFKEIIEKMVNHDIAKYAK